jgi:uncharacterized metal-binding protein
MRKGVIVCGANGERGLMIEQAIEIFSPKNLSRIIQFSACTVGTTPMLISMSGIDPDHVIAVNGCRNLCCDRILEKAGMKAERSVVLDDATERKLCPCQFTSEWDFPDIDQKEIEAFVKLMENALD